MGVTDLFRKVMRRMVRWSAFGRPRTWHVTRIEPYRRLAEACQPLVKPDDRALSISRSTRGCLVVGIEASNVVEADYPEYDMRDLPFDDASFEWVVADHVLEHVESDPFRAFAEAVRVTKPGGHVVVTTPTVYPKHLAPDDYWRFTVHGLRSMAGDLEIVESGEWGNRLVWVADLLGLRFAPVPDIRWHPLRWIARLNEPDWPLQSWLVARVP